MPLDISWNLNGNEISSGHGIVINMVNKRLSTLSIESVQAEHAGEYKCIAKNAAGKAEHSSYLKVNGTFNIST